AEGADERQQAAHRPQDQPGGRVADVLEDERRRLVDAGPDDDADDDVDGVEQAQGPGRGGWFSELRGADAMEEGGLRLGYGSAHDAPNHRPVGQPVRPFPAPRGGSKVTDYGVGVRVSTRRAVFSRPNRGAGGANPAPAGAVGAC